MKVLMINVVCGIRSTGRICTDLATALEAQGHEVKIAYGREEVPEKFQKYAVRIGNDLDVKLHGVKARLFDGCGFGSKSATEKFIKWVKEWNPDVIHLHNIHGYYINIEVLFDYLRTCGKKIIWTLHDCWAFTGHSAYCDAVNCERWVTKCYNCPNKAEYPASLIDRSRENWKRKKDLLNGIQNLNIVTPSEWLAGLVKKSFLAQYPVTVIHNGIDTSQFYPLENDTREYFGIGDKFMLLGVATAWDEMKGFPDYLKLADMLGDGYQVVLVGLTKEQIAKLPNNVVGIERTNSVKELAQLYSAADIYLNLSYCENYPTTNLEAMACGTPVLTYRTGGSPESIKEYEGIVVDRGDIEGARSAIVEHRNKNRNRNKPDIHVKNTELDNETTVKSYLENYPQGGYWAYKESLGLIGRKVILGVAAIWDKRKGLDDIIEMSRIIDDQIIVVGVTDEQNEKLPENIIAYTRTNNVDELRKLYAVADVFVNPTYEDNFPTTNIEALACGTPVITYNTGGSSEVVFPGTGIVVERGNCSGVCTAISNMKFNGNNCHETSLKFTVIRMNNRYTIELYS